MLNINVRDVSLCFTIIKPWSIKRGRNTDMDRREFLPVLILYSGFNASASRIRTRAIPLSICSFD